MSERPCVIVSGASRGLGAAIARILAEMGAAVIVTARSAVPLDALVNEIRAADGRAFAIAGDISDPNTARRCVHAALDNFGRVDAVVNNAAIIEPIARLADVDAEAWRRLFDVNVLGAVLLTQAALPHLRERQGRVINVSSGAAVHAIRSWGAYCASKAALNMFNETLAAEEPQITAIAVRPGVVDTPMQDVIRERGADAMPPEDYAQFVALHRERQLLPPAKPGRAIAALALHAPRAWSGEFVHWDDPRVGTLGAGAR